MPRHSDSTGSLDRAARHLFRHLHDAQSLRLNPLIAHLLRDSPNSGPAIEIVARLASEYGSRGTFRKPRAAATREQAVFTRLVLNREQWTTVSADLGLSRRQLARDKLAIGRWIAARLKRYARSLWPASVTARAADADARIAAAHVRAECGDIAGAFAALHDVAESGAPPLTRFTALCAHARIQADYASSAGAALKALEEARTFAGSCDEFTGTMSPIIGACLDTVESKILRERAPIAQARSKLDAAQAALCKAEATGHTFASAELGRTLAERGSYEHFTGQPAAARRLLIAALERLSDSSERNPIVRVDALMYLGHVLRESRKTLPDSVSTLGHALESARAAGLRSRALVASIMLSECELLSGDQRAARARAIECVAVADAIGTPALILIASFNAADLMLVDLSVPGSANLVDRLLERSARLAEPCSFGSVMIEAKQASLALSCGNVMLGFAKASSADAQAVTLDNPRLRATTLRVLAECQARSGQRNVAIGSIREAVALSERHGTWCTQADNLRVAAALTGNADLRRRAGELDYGWRAS